MINRFALSFLCIELDRDKTCGVTLLYILLATLTKQATDFRGSIFSREDIFARGYFREKIFSREDIFAGRYFRVNSIFAKIFSRENISNSLFAKFSSRENKVLYSTHLDLATCPRVPLRASGDEKSRSLTVTGDPAGCMPADNHLF